MPEYRIRRDTYLGYEVQRRMWWWPFWHMPGCNTFPNVEQAERFARDIAQPVVKHLGRL